MDGGPKRWGGPARADDDRLLNGLWGDFSRHFTYESSYLDSAIGYLGREPVISLES